MPGSLWVRKSLLAVAIVGAVGAAGCRGEEQAINETVVVRQMQDSINRFLATHVLRTVRGDRVSAAVAADSALFSSALVNALRIDRAAQARVPGEVVGLDFDPFTNSQDPCEEYRALDATKRADTLAFPVYAVCAGGRAAAPVATYLVSREGSQLVVVDIEYEETGSRLRSVLAVLREERETPET